MASLLVGELTVNRHGIPALMEKKKITLFNVVKTLCC